MIGMGEGGTAARYRRFAQVEVHGVSPSYEALCLGVAGDSSVLGCLEGLPSAKRQPNLLLAAVRFLGGSVSSYPAFRDFVLTGWDAVAAVMRARRTQTNEPRRCATLLPVFAALPQPLALLEVGASAGLCLFPDRYAYRYAGDGGEHRIDPSSDGPSPDGYSPDGMSPSGTSPVELRCAVDGPVPLPDAPPSVAWRAGLDLNPLDVRDDEDVRWLESLIWPEQSERFDVLAGAVELARADPPHLARGDLLTDLPGLAEQAPRDATLVVFHTAVLAYVDAPGREAFADTVRGLGATWISNEAPGVVTGTELDRDGRFVLARDQRPVALTGPHGQSLSWLP